MEPSPPHPPHPSAEWRTRVLEFVTAGSALLPWADETWRECRYGRHFSTLPLFLLSWYYAALDGRLPRTVNNSPSLRLV